MKTIVHIITSLEDGGAQQALFRVISQTNFRHVVICLLSPSKYSMILTRQGFSVYHLSLKSPLKALHSALALIPLLFRLKRESPVILQSWLYHADLFASLISLLTGISVLWNIRHSDHGRGTKATTLFTVRILGLISKYSPKSIIYCSSQSIYHHRKLGYPDSKSIHIPNGFVVAHSPPAHLDYSVVRIGMLARYHPQKGHERLIRVFSQVHHSFPNARLILAGPYINHSNHELQSLLLKNNALNSVELLGQLSDTASFYRSLHLFILPSVYGEGFPNVLGEAMSFYVPCITTNVGDAFTIVSSTGWLVNNQSDGALASSIHEALWSVGTQEWHNKRLAAYHRIKSKYSLKNTCNLYTQNWLKWL